MIITHTINSLLAQLIHKRIEMIIIYHEKIFRTYIHLESKRDEKQNLLLFRDNYGNYFCL